MNLSRATVMHFADNIASAHSACGKSTMGVGLAFRWDRVTCKNCQRTKRRADRFARLAKPAEPAHE